MCVCVCEIGQPCILKFVGVFCGVCVCHCVCACVHMLVHACVFVWGLFIICLFVFAGDVTTIETSPAVSSDSSCSDITKSSCHQKIKCLWSCHLQLSL